MAMAGAEAKGPGGSHRWASEFVSLALSALTDITKSFKLRLPGALIWRFSVERLWVE